MSTKNLSEAKKITGVMVIIATILSLYVYFISPYVNDYVNDYVQTKFSTNTETIKYKDISKDVQYVGFQLYEAGVQRGVYESLNELIKYGAEDFNTKRVIDRAMKSLIKETEND
jgi:hypothetical protein